MIIGKKIDRIDTKSDPNKRKFINYNFQDSREKRFWEELEGFKYLQKQQNSNMSLVNQSQLDQYYPQRQTEYVMIHDYGQRP